MGSDTNVHEKEDHDVYILLKMNLYNPNFAFCLLQCNVPPLYCSPVK